MALSSIWDIASDGEIEKSAIGGNRLVRCGIIKGVTTATVTSSKLALLNAIAGAPGIHALGDVYDAAFPEYVCLHIVARAIPNTGGSMIRVWEHFQTPGGDTPLERFAAEDDVSLQSEPTTVYPGTARQIRCSTTSGSPTYDSFVLRDTDRPITVNYPRAMRTLVLYGLFSDRPSNAVKNAVNTVNDSMWEGLGRGRWKCIGTKSAYSSQDGLFRVTVGFLTKGAGLGADWSSYEVPRKPNGELALVRDDVLTTEQNKQYDYKIMSDKNALWHAGLYPLTNFASVFGANF